MKQKYICQDFYRLAKLRVNVLATSLAIVTGDIRCSQKYYYK